jgi:hypothetical protein
MCFTLSSSTVQLHDSLGSDGHVQRLVSVVKIATVLEGCTIEKQSFIVPFFPWEKGLNAKDIHKEMFPIYGGKCLWRKAVQNWAEKRGQRFADEKEIEI